MKNIKHYRISEEINFTYIPNTKFKTTLISVAMFTPMDKKTASVNAILPNILIHSCSKYPSLIDISKRLEELYGASVSPSVQKIGDMQVIGISAQSINSKFVPDDSDNILELTKLLCDMIFEPHLTNGVFTTKNIESEKRQLKEEILAEMNDKKIFARKRCIEIMCKNEKFGTNTLGTIEDAKKITEKSAFEAWKNLLSSSHVEITMVGCGAHEKIMNEFKERFEKIERKNICEYSCELKSVNDTAQEITEQKNVVQCKLVMGLRAKNADESINYPAMKLMNALLGGTPQSKLFLNVREKMSLCYYCASRYLKQKKIMLIESGVEKKNIQKAKEQILEQVKDIRLGNFSDKDLNETKLFIVQALEKIEDSLSALDSWYLSQSIERNQKSVAKHISEINSVSREEIIKAANQIELDTVYILSGKDE